MDVVDRPYPQWFIDPNESGLVQGYSLADNEVATFGRYLNRAPAGAVYDLNSRTGTPLIGQGGGIYCVNNSGSWNTPDAVPNLVGYEYITEQDTDPTATQFIMANGGGATAHYIRHLAAAWFQMCMDGGVTFTPVSPGVGSGAGRGPMLLSIFHRDGSQRGYINGNPLGSAVVALTNCVGGSMLVGRHDTHRRVTTYRIAKSDAEIRAGYVKNLAKNVVWSWTPKDVGEGPAGGILTNSTPGGYAVCVDGSATFQHVWRPDLSIPAGGRLCLTETNPALARRIAISHTKMPIFGSWLIKYQVRDPATDSMQIGFTQLPGSDYTGAGSQSYWIHLRQVAGPWWRCSLYYQNGAQIDAADTPSLPVAGDRGAILLTHAVDGTWQIYSYLASLRSWYWSIAAPVDVSILSSNYVVIVPRGAYVESIERFQSEATPHELGIIV